MDTLITQLDQLNARYYSGIQGQFISEDPLFWATPKQQNIIDPQSLNSYSYSEDNPITKEDPSGKCVEDGCFLELEGIGTVSGFGVGVISQGVQDIQNGHFSGLGAYASSGGKGAVVGASTVAAAYLGAGAAVVGLTAGVSGAAYDILQNMVANKQNNWGDIGVNNGITALTGGLLDGYVPKVPGVVPNLFDEAFFTGSHMTNSIYQNIIDLGAHSVFTSGASFFGSYVVKNNTTYMQTSGGGLQSTSLPATISQGGATYYRNSSGLLSTSPGK
jgi:RHS repeat-associated protein